LRNKGHGEGHAVGEQAGSSHKLFITEVEGKTGEKREIKLKMKRVKEWG